MIRSMLSSSSPCNANFYGFVIWEIVIVLIKIFDLIAILVHWNHRIWNKKGAKRFPRLPVILFVQVILHVIFFTTTATDLLNSSNAGGMVMYTWIYLSFSTACFLVCRHFIHLGKSVIPLARQISLDSDQEQILAKEDFLLKILMIFQVCSILLGWIFGAIVILFFVKENQGLWQSISFYFQVSRKPVFSLTLTFQSYRQFIFC